MVWRLEQLSAITVYQFDEFQRGLVLVRGRQGACNLTFTGAIDANNGFSLFGVGPISTTTFPQFPGPVYGLTDYNVGTISADQWLYPLWIQPIESTGNCTACNGKKYSTVVNFARVVP